ncbi:MAG: HAD family hydrolase [Candidatus Hermodarchaeota archaeon]
MIRNVIFDLGNVLLNFKPEIFLFSYVKDENFIKSFISNVISSEIWLNLDRGTLTIKNAKKQLINKFPEEKKFISTFFKHWMKMLTPIDENVKILYNLKSNGYRVYILSNYIQEAFKYVKNKYNFISIFDGVVISGNVKVMKPEIEIYQKLVDKYKIVPEECVFIDDIESNLFQARRMGMKTIFYLPNTNLSEELKKIGINL